AVGSCEHPFSAHGKGPDTAVVWQDLAPSLPVVCGAKETIVRSGEDVCATREKRPNAGKGAAGGPSCATVVRAKQPTPIESGEEARPTCESIDIADRWTARAPGAAMVVRVEDTLSRSGEQTGAAYGNRHDDCDGRQTSVDRVPTGALVIGMKETFARC